MSYNLADLFYLDHDDLKSKVTCQVRTMGRPDDNYGPLRVQRVFKDAKGFINMQFEPFVSPGNVSFLEDFYYDGDHVVQIRGENPRGAEPVDALCRFTLTLYSNGQREPHNWVI